MSSAEMDTKIEELKQEQAGLGGKKTAVVDALREKMSITEDSGTEADVLRAAQNAIAAAQEGHAGFSADIASIDANKEALERGRQGLISNLEENTLVSGELRRRSEVVGTLNYRDSRRLQKHQEHVDARDKFVHDKVDNVVGKLTRGFQKHVLRRKEVSTPDYFAAKEVELRATAAEKGYSENWVTRRMAAEHMIIERYNEARNIARVSEYNREVSDAETHRGEISSSLVDLASQRAVIEGQLTDVKTRESGVQQSTDFAGVLESLLKRQQELDDREVTLEQELVQANQQFSEELAQELHAEGYLLDVSGKKQETLFKLGTEAVYRTAFDARVDADGEPRDPVDVVSRAAEGVGAYLEYYRTMKQEAEGIEQGREVVSELIEAEIASAVEGLTSDKRTELYRQEEVLSEDSLSRLLAEQKAFWSANFDLPKLKYLMNTSKEGKSGEKAKLAYQRAQEKVEQKLQKIRDTQDTAVQRAESKLQKWMTTELPKQIDTHRKLKMKEYVDSMLADLPLGDRKRVTEMAYDVALSEAETAMANLEKWKMLLENPEGLKQKIVDALAEQQATVDVAAEYLDSLYGGVAGIEDRIKAIRSEQRKLKDSKAGGKKSERDTKTARLELERLGLVDQKEGLMREVREVEEEVRKNKLGGRGMLNKLLRQNLPPELFGEKAYPDNGDTQVAELYKYVAYGQPAPDFAQEASDAPTRHHLQLDSFFDQVAPSLDSLKADITGAVGGRSEALKAGKQAEMAQRAMEARETLVGTLNERLIEMGAQSWNDVLTAVNKASTAELGALSREAAEVVLRHADELTARVALIVEEIGALPADAGETEVDAKIDELSRIDVIIKRGAEVGASTRLEDLSARIAQTVEALKKPEEPAPEPGTTS